MTETILSITVKEYESHLDEETVISGKGDSVIPAYFLLGAKIFSALEDPALQSMFIEEVANSIMEFAEVLEERNAG